MLCSELPSLQKLRRHHQTIHIQKNNSLELSLNQQTQLRWNVSIQYTEANEQKLIASRPSQGRTSYFEFFSKKDILKRPVLEMQLQHHLPDSLALNDSTQTGPLSSSSTPNHYALNSTSRPHTYPNNRVQPSGPPATTLEVASEQTATTEPVLLSAHLTNRINIISINVNGFNNRRPH